MDRRVASKIGELIDNGVSNIREIERSLKSYIVHELFKDQVPPHFSNRRFFPTHRDIRNHYNACFNKRKLANIDQENVHCLVEEWKEKAEADDKYLFRPYKANVENKGAGEDNIKREKPQTLLFIHQMAWQQRLLLRYGQNICLLDATYKTSRYALPFFQLCVKTNVGYQVVATFAIQNECEDDIAEALQYLQEWNPKWRPRFFMTDKCDAEIKAVEATFSGMFNCKI